MITIPVLVDLLSCLCNANPVLKMDIIIKKLYSMFLQVAEVFTNNPGKLVPIDQTISGFKEILEGKYDHLPEVAFYMVGNIDEVSHIPLVLDLEQQPVGSAFIS